MNNQKTLFLLRLLKSFVATFTDNFLVLYFINTSDNNILTLGIYKIIAVIVTFLVIFMCRNLARSKHRVMLLRIGIVLDLAQLLAVMVLRENVAQYIYIIGLLYGLEEGFYYSVYNLMESDGIENRQRAKFTGIYAIAKSVFAIIFPLVFGGLIQTAGFFKTLLIVLGIVAVRIMLSFVYRDKNIPRRKKTDIQRFLRTTLPKKRFRQLYALELVNGLAYSGSAFSCIVTVYIVKVFSDSFGLGVFTSIFSIVTCVIGFLFAKKLKPKHYSLTLLTTMTLMISSFLAMIFVCNPVTIITFNFFYTVASGFGSLINENSQANLCNDRLIRREFKTEFWSINELCLVIGRVVSAGLFIAMAYFEPQPIMLMFAGFWGLLMICSMQLQHTLGRDRQFMKQMVGAETAKNYREIEKE